MMPAYGMPAKGGASGDAQAASAAGAHAPVSIVFADMDDTFLARDKTVPAGNLALLDRMGEKGVPFVPCTGRVWSAVSGQVLGHAATCYVVASDGAVVMDVRDMRSPRRLHLSALGRERALALYERVRELPVTFDAFWDGKIYVSRRRFELMRGFDIPPYDRDMYLRYRTPMDMTTPQLLESLPNVERLTIFTGTDDVRARAIEAVAADSTLHYTYSSARNLEVMDKGTSKGAAVRWLCDYLGIPRAQSVGFGDSPNDLTMLVAVGDGVAVANAYPEAKAAATHVAPWTCDESAPARYLGPLL